MSAFNIGNATGSSLSAISMQPGAQSALQNRHANGGQADELKKHFNQFVGESFYGQMLKSMRSTVGKPAYFHGGRAEEVFQGQLDMELAKHFTEASADKFTEPLFERQFPHLAKSSSSNDLAQLGALSRR